MSWKSFQKSIFGNNDSKVGSKLSSKDSIRKVLKFCGDWDFDTRKPFAQDSLHCSCAESRFWVGSLHPAVGFPNLIGFLNGLLEFVCSESCLWRFEGSQGSRSGGNMQEICNIHVVWKLWSLSIHLGGKVVRSDSFNMYSRSNYFSNWQFISSNVLLFVVKLCAIKSGRTLPVYVFVLFFDLYVMKLRDIYTGPFFFTWALFALLKNSLSPPNSGFRNTISFSPR